MAPLIRSPQPSPRFRLSLRAKGVAGLVVPLTALFAALFAIYWAEGRFLETDIAAVRAWDARTELPLIQVRLLEVENAVTGYAATGDPALLAAFESARAATDRSLERLAPLVADDPPSRATLDEIRRGVSTAMSSLAGLRAFSGAPDARFRALSAAQQLGRETAARLTVMGREQDLRLEQARYNREVARVRLFRIITLCGFIGPLGALFVHLILYGRLVGRLQRVRENTRRLALNLPLEPVHFDRDEIGTLALQIEDTAALLRARERELRESEHRFRDLFDRAPIAFEESNREGFITRFNQAVCDLLKTTPDRVLGRSAWDFVAPDQQEALRSAMLQRIATGEETAPFECDYLLENGSHIRVEIRENLVRSEIGEVTGVRRSLLDVTERNLAAIAARKVEQYALELRNKNEQLGRALAAARSAVEAKTRFLAAVSHELRTPLNSIIGFSEMMYDGKVGPINELQHDCLDDILTSSRHLLGLINDILDLSKVEAGRMEFRPQNCLLETMVREVGDVMQPLAQKKRISLTTEAPGWLAAVIDPARFKQVLYNYLSNAVKFTPEGGAIHVAISTPEEGFFRLDVADTGIGVPADQISLLFQEFQQLPNNRKAEQGTGLGLALTRHIVEAQGGRVEVRSLPGGGSTFSAVLPLSTSGNGTVEPKSVLVG